MVALQTRTGNPQATLEAGKVISNVKGWQGEESQLEEVKTLLSTTFASNNAYTGQKGPAYVVIKWEVGLIALKKGPSVAGGILVAFYDKEESTELTTIAFNSTTDFDAWMESRTPQWKTTAKTVQCDIAPVIGINDPATLSQSDSAFSGTPVKVRVYQSCSVIGF